MMTDESLMTSVKNDNLQDASILYERYKVRLYKYFLFKNGNDEEVSEDCVQQVFYRIIKYRKSYRDDSNFIFWMFSIARNILLQEVKDKIRRQSLPAHILTDVGYSPTNDDHDALKKAIGLLPAAYKDVIVLSKFMGLKYEEIARLNNCSEGVIKTRVFRAVKMLKEKYLKLI